MSAVTEQREEPAQTGTDPAGLPSVATLPEPVPLFTRSRAGLIAGGVVLLAGVFLLSRAFSDTGTAPAQRYPGLALVVIGGVCVLGPGVLWADLRAAARAAVSRAERAHVAALLVIVAIGAVLRVIFVDLPMRYDESTTFLTFVNAPISEGLANYANPNNHFLNTLLMHYAWRAFGTDPVALRVPVLLVGAALVPAIYVAGRALYDRTVGLLAAALAAPSGALVGYSVNARGYAYVALATVILLPLGAYAVRRRSGAAWVIWAAVAALGMWSIPTMVYALAIVVVWLGMLFWLDLPREWRFKSGLVFEHGLLVAMAFTLVLYQPVLGAAAFIYHDQSVNSALPGKVWHGFSAGYGPLWWVLVAGAVAAIVLHRRVSRWRAPLWGAILIVVPLALLGSDRVPPFVRTWLFLLPMVLLLSAAGIVATARLVAERRPALRRPLPALVVPLAAAAIGAALLGAGDLFTEDDPPTYGAPEQAAYLATHLRPGDGLAVSRYTAPMHDFYLRRRGVNVQMTVGPIMALQGAAPGHRTYVALLKVRPLTTQFATLALPFLKGMRRLQQTRDGAIYLSPPAPLPKAKASGGTNGP